MRNLTRSTWRGDAQAATEERALASIGGDARGGLARQRRLHTDNLRILLTRLVVIVHAAMTYGNIRPGRAKDEMIWDGRAP